MQRYRYFKIKPILLLNKLRMYLLVESAHMGVNQRSKDFTQQQQRPESPTVTLTWHTCKC